MPNLQVLEIEELMDMLSQQTAQLTAKIAEKSIEGMQQYEYEIAMIQAEINSRHQFKGNSSIF